MKYLVSSLALILANFGACLMNAQTPSLQRGISVQLAATDHASAIAEADQPSAWIVTITSDGGIYLATNAVTPESLYDQMKHHSRKLPKEVFVKADARAPYITVEQALQSLHRFFPAVIILTSQPGATVPDARLMPQGFEVTLDSHDPKAGPRIELDSNQVVRVNGQQIPANLLEQTLRNLMPENKERTIPVDAKGQVPFSEVAHVIDVCTSLGSRISLTLPNQ